MSTAILRSYLNSDGLSSRWKIGNVQEFGNDYLYFRIGRRVTKKYGDYIGRDFIDDKASPAVYTHVFIDLKYELCAICKNTTLSSRTYTIANQLIKLLRRTEVVALSRVTLSISEIIDATAFLEMLRSAHTVVQYWCFFPRKNAFDVEEDFIKPGQQAIEHALAEKGRVELFGHNLNIDYLEELTRSVSSLGERGGAKVTSIRGGRVKNIYYDKNPVTFEIDEVDSEDSRRRSCTELRDIYESIRHRG